MLSAITSLFGASKTKEAMQPVEPANSGLSQSLEDVVSRLSQEALKEAYLSISNVSLGASPPLILSKHEGCIHSLAVLPSGDLASASDDTTIRIWDTLTGKCKQILQGHKDQVWSLAVLPSGDLASGDFEANIHIWDTHTGKCKQTLQGNKGTAIPSLAILPSGDLVSGGWGIRIWNTYTGVCRQAGKCRQVLKEPTSEEYAHSFAVLPSGKLASTIGHIICIWNIYTGKCLHTLERHTADIVSLAVLPSGDLASASNDKTIRVWNTHTGECRQVLKGHESYVNSLAVLPSGHLASASSDSTIRIWNIHTGECQQTLHQDEHALYYLAVLPSGDLASASYDTIRIWSWKKGELLSQEAGVNAILEKEFRRRGLEKGGKDHKQAAPSFASSTHTSTSSSLSSLSSLHSQNSSSISLAAEPLPRRNSLEAQQKIETLMKQMVELQAKDQEKSKKLAQIEKENEQRAIKEAEYQKEIDRLKELVEPGEDSSLQNEPAKKDKKDHKHSPLSSFSLSSSTSSSSSLSIQTSLLSSLPSIERNTDLPGRSSKQPEMTDTFGLKERETLSLRSFSTASSNPAAIKSSRRRKSIKAQQEIETLKKELDELRARDQEKTQKLAEYEKEIARLKKLVAQWEEPGGVSNIE